MPDPSSDRTARDIEPKDLDDRSSDVLARAGQTAMHRKPPRASHIPRVGVVLAAGRAERLAAVTGGQPKALVVLGGMPLVERAVLTLLRAGLERVVVVVGHSGDSVEEALAGTPEGRVQVVTAKRWEAGNGASFAAVEEAVAGEDRFLLLCGDTVVAESALDDLVRTAEPAVLVDQSPSPEAWREGTRVDVRDGTAVAFGKQLEGPGIDCGVFVLGPDAFNAQRRAASAGDHSLAGAMTEVARTRPMKVVTLPARAWWQDVDTPEDLKAARSLLRRSLSSPSDGPVSRHLNRPISTRITMALSPFRLSPNLLSLVAFVIGLWAAWSLSAGRAVVGGLLVQANSVLDGLDGETARLHFRVSARGARLDALGDRMVDAATIAGAILWIWPDPSRLFRSLIIAAAAAGWGLVALLVKEKTATFELPSHRPRPLALSLLGRDVRMFILSVGCMLAVPEVGLAVGFLIYCGSGILRVVRVVKLGWNPFRSKASAEELRQGSDKGPPG